jgi:hypothetical protein
VQEFSERSGVAVEPMLPADADVNRLFDRVVTEMQARFWLYGAGCLGARARVLHALS